ncbi:MAG: hypothetical protein ACPG5B_09550 [Chitinophagales bacterium]
MDFSQIVMYVGFLLAGYSVVGNDSIQTLGTFLSSNEKRPWYVLWLFAGSILTTTLVYGWYQYGGDVSYGRLGKYPLPEVFEWYYLLPPLVLMSITRIGIPVSTSFLILTFFNEKNLYDMMFKSMSGYLVAFVAAIVVYMVITKSVEKRFLENPMTEQQRFRWSIAQWFSTGFLWSMWLIQDFANIYVYLPRELDFATLIGSLVVLLSLLAYIFYSRGGAIQKIVKAKTNTTDIRSATIVDAIYGVVLFYFKELNNVPMSTTWVFIGLLAGRELAIRYQLHKKLDNATLKDVGMDLGKISLGLGISIVLVFMIKAMS